VVVEESNKLDANENNECSSSNNACPELLQEETEQKLQQSEHIQEKFLTISLSVLVC